MSEMMNPVQKYNENISLFFLPFHLFLLGVKFNYTGTHIYIISSHRKIQKIILG